MGTASSLSDSRHRQGTHLFSISIKDIEIDYVSAHRDLLVGKTGKSCREVERVEFEFAEESRTERKECCVGRNVAKISAGERRAWWWFLVVASVLHEKR